jgi:nucleoside-diphosphate-sugar epimerase
MADIVNSVKNKTVFVTNSQNIKRDFVHPKDLFQLIVLCMKQKSMNSAIDLYSKKPISKFEIIKYFQDKYGLTYKIKKILKNKTKTNYYTTKKFNELGYKPKFSSMDSIMDESKFFFDYD